MIHFIGNDIFSCIDTTFGTVLVGNDKWQMQIGNGNSSACNTLTCVYIMNDYNYERVKGMKLSGIIKGKFNVYKGDCYAKLDQLRDEDNILAKLDGDYLVYVKNGDVTFARGE